ncbi:hypothetical protein BGZ60DRAFT_182075 [Tricladium varicosporioides]|nr:hypothetical protein BGZ60DRAFT_182075 [Hymenoscyphus varicosporioides]
MANRSIETPYHPPTIPGLPPGNLNRDRTSRACRRCQRQKLKCDTEKPCILCRRAGVECEVSRGITWKTQFQSSYPRSKRQKRKQAQPEACQGFDPSLFQSMPSSDGAERPSESVPSAGATQQSRSGSPKSSHPDSSTLDLVKEVAFLYQMRCEPLDNRGNRLLIFISLMISQLRSLRRCLEGVCLIPQEHPIKLEQVPRP